MPNDVGYLEFESHVVEKHVYSKLKCYRIPRMNNKFPNAMSLLKT